MRREIANNINRYNDNVVLRKSQEEFGTEKLDTIEDK
jgi:hypothetical protein